MKYPTIYVGSPDGQMRPFISKAAFQRSMILSMLFQGDLVIPDIFFFISPYLSDMVLGGQQGLSTWVKHGVVVPTFRHPDDYTFTQALATVRRQNIIGIEPRADEVASTLDKAIESSRNARIMHWPDSPFDVGYRTTVERSLAGDPRSEDSELHAIWERTAKLRQVCIDEAIGSSPAGGLRRGEIYKSVARFLGLPENDAGSAQQLIDGAGQMSNPSDIVYFLKWINYSYHFNQGVQFGLNPALANMDRTDLEFSQNLYPASDRSGDAKPPCRVQFPLHTSDQLLSVPATALLEIRNGDAGGKFFNLLSQYQKEPSDESATKLGGGLIEYARQIRTKAITDGINIANILDTWTALLPTGTSEQTKTLSKILLGSLAVAHVPGLLVYKSVCQLAPILIRVLPHAMADRLTKPLDPRSEVVAHVTEEESRLSTIYTGECFTDAVYQRDSV